MSKQYVKFLNGWIFGSSIGLTYSIVGALGMGSGGGEVVRAMTSSLRGPKLELSGQELFFLFFFCSVSLVWGETLTYPIFITLSGVAC